MTRRRRLAIACGLGALLLLVAAGVIWLVVWPMFLVDGVERDLRRHNITAARATLKRFLAASPNDHRAILLAAKAARRANAHAEAERFLGQFETTFGPTDASRREWTLLGVQQGDFGDNESRLRSAVDQNPGEASAILEALAKGYDASYRWPEAVSTLDRLLARSPDHVPALLLRSTIQQRLRQTEAAEKDFREAVKRAPNNASAHAGLANLLFNLGRTSEAIEHFETALRLEPGDPMALLGLARAHLDAAQLDSAQRRLDDVLAIKHDHADALVERGRLSLRRGKPGEAETLLARAVNAGPWRPDAHKLHLAALIELKRPDEASRRQARLAELQEEQAIAGRLKLRAHSATNDVKVRWELWLWSQRNGETAEGIAWLAEILRVDPRHRPARQAFAEYFDRAGQPRRADSHRAIAASAK